MKAEAHKMAIPGSANTSPFCESPLILRLSFRSYHCPDFSVDLRGPVIALRARQVKEPDAVRGPVIVQDSEFQTKDTT